MSLEKLNELKERKETFDRIVEWRNRADNASDNAFNRFILRWISFNGLYSALYGMDYGQEATDREREGNLINHFCEEYILKNKILASNIFSNDINKVFEDNIKDTTRYMEKYLKNLKCEEDIEKKAVNMIKIAYKIRCRLFHGEKNPNLEVNKTVVGAADKVIIPILEYFIEKIKN